MSRIIKTIKMNQKSSQVSSVALKAALLTFFTITFLQFFQTAVAETLQSDSYIIQFGNFNVTSGEKSSAGYTVTDTVGQFGAGPYGEYGTSSFFLGGGFQYIYQINEFSFVISNTAIDLGELVPGNFSSDSNTLTISTRGAGGYNVYAYELHELRHTIDSTHTVPDTLCDSGPCTSASAEIWNMPENAGFGFNMDGDTVPLDFESNAHYRPFANDELSQPMQAVMSSEDIGSDDEATVTYKASINPTQAAGRYETTVVYVAVPGY